MEIYLWWLQTWNARKRVIVDDWKCWWRDWCLLYNRGSLVNNQRKQNSNRGWKIITYNDLMK